MVTVYRIFDALLYQIKQGRGDMEVRPSLVETGTCGDSVSHEIIPDYINASQRGDRTIVAGLIDCEEEWVELQFVKM